MLRFRSLKPRMMVTLAPVAEVVALQIISAMICNKGRIVDLMHLMHA